MYPVVVAHLGSPAGQKNKNSQKRGTLMHRITGDHSKIGPAVRYTQKKLYIFLFYYYGGAYR